MSAQAIQAAAVLHREKSFLGSVRQHPGPEPTDDSMLGNLSAAGCRWLLSKVGLSRLSAACSCKCVAAAMGVLIACTVL